VVSKYSKTGAFQNKLQIQQFSKVESLVDFLF